MKKANAISAIEGPCKVNGIEVEPGFSEELINKLSPSGTDVELTYLQIYLDRIFKIASEDKTETEGLIFSNELLNRAGSVSDLLGQFLDEQVRQLDDPDTGMSILKSFVSVQGTKRQMNEYQILDTIKTFGTIISQPDLLKCLTRFVDLRILREKDESGNFELRHDSLASKIYEKFTAIEKDIIEVRQYIENALSAYEKRGKLLTVDDLKYIAPYEDKLYLNKSSEVLIHNSKNEITRIRRRRRSFATVISIALIVVLSGLTIWAMKERKKSEIQSSLAEQQKNEALIANQLAEVAKKEAIVQKTLANENEQKAVESRSIALNAKAIAENELYRNIKNSLTVSIEKNKVLYVGVENPISISVSGIPNNRLRVSVSGNSKIAGKDGKYLILPKFGDDAKSMERIEGPDGKIYTVSIQLDTAYVCRITVCAMMKNGSLDTIGYENFELREIPDPPALFTGNYGGQIHKADILEYIPLLGKPNLVIQRDNYIWENFKVTGFKLTINHNGKEESQWSKSAALIDEQIKLIEKLEIRDFLIFDSVSAIGPDEKVRQLKSLIFQIY
jgi:hypothetical protein